jgi:hypothetical protein
MFPDQGVINCDLPNITIAGAFCTEAPNATIAFSEDSTCALANLMGVTKATLSADGQSVSAPGVDLSSITSPKQLYACFSATGPAGPFYPSDSAILTMNVTEVGVITPNVSTAGCQCVPLIISPAASRKCCLPCYQI